MGTRTIWPGLRPRWRWASGRSAPEHRTDDELAAALPDHVVDDFGVTSEAALRERLHLAEGLGMSFVALSVFPIPLRLRKSFPPVPGQRPALEATRDCSSRRTP